MPVQLGMRRPPHLLLLPTSAGTRHSHSRCARNDLSRTASWSPPLTPLTHCLPAQWAGVGSPPAPTCSCCLWLVLVVLAVSVWGCTRRNQRKCTAETPAWSRPSPSRVRSRSSTPRASQLLADEQPQARPAPALRAYVELETFLANVQNLLR
ncbi:hypothetical protein B484DRAFT_118862 [Ochromonadaceae sp. CCMP2298]|nr:hypothetical protein B484DRAFT_118862 [Ochromonadaceae sp. CCMP2298]